MHCHARGTSRAAFLMALTGCTWSNMPHSGPFPPSSSEPSSLTPLEIRGMQTREFRKPGRVVFESVVSAFEELDYAIDGADIETGVITGKRVDCPWCGKMFIDNVIPPEIRATGFVESYGKKTAVLIHFTEIVFLVGFKEEEKGVSIRSILQPDLYQDAFKRITRKLRSHPTEGP